MVCQWPGEEWVLCAAYVAMDIDETTDYEKVKSAILLKYDISAETYRVRLQSSDVEPGLTPKKLQARLKDLFDSSGGDDVGESHLEEVSRSNC